MMPSTYEHNFLSDQLAMNAALQVKSNFLKKLKAHDKAIELITLCGEISLHSASSKVICERVTRSIFDDTNDDINLSEQRPNKLYEAMFLK